jgi:hypothetical protein
MANITVDGLTLSEFDSDFAVALYRLITKIAKTGNTERITIRAGRDLDSIGVWSFLVGPTTKASLYDEDAGDDVIAALGGTVETLFAEYAIDFNSSKQGAESEPRPSPGPTSIPRSSDDPNPLTMDF